MLQGQTLRERLTEGALPLRLAVDYAGQIVQGLIAAHDHRIVHRDLKPENLFVTSEGRIKILDFGVAKLQSSPEESGRSVEELTTVTKSGVLVGTVAYMSPEQLRAKAVDHRSDIFSVGAILYEMLTGSRAFRGETEVDTITAVLLENPPEINLEKASVPVSFQQIVRHCLEKEPEKSISIGARSGVCARNSGQRFWHSPAPGSPLAGKHRPLGSCGNASGCDALLLLGKQWQQRTHNSVLSAFDL